MATFQRLETIVIRGTTKDENDDFITPSTSTEITVTDSAGTEVVNDQDVTFDAVGKWKYLYTPDADSVAGAHHIRVTATDGSRLSVADSQFFLVT